MDRRSFLAWTALAPVSAATEFAGLRRRYRQMAGPPFIGTPLPTGLKDLDDALRGGLTPSAVTLFVSRDHAVVSDLALNIVNYHLQHSAGPVAYLDASRIREDVVTRLACIRSGTLNPDCELGMEQGPERLAAHAAARSAIEAEELHYEDLRRLRPIADVERSLRKVHEAHPLRLIVLDHVAALRDIQCAGTDQTAVAQAGRRLRGLARSLRVPILACCHVPRGESGFRKQPPLRQADLGPLVPILDSCDACWMTGDCRDSTFAIWRSR